MVAGGTVLTVALFVAGVGTLAQAVVEGRTARAALSAAGVALVIAGHLLRAADTLGWLPDLLGEGVDDEDAVATLVGLTALLVGGLLILPPVAVVADARTQWSIATFALLGLVVVVVHVLVTFAFED